MLSTEQIILGIIIVVIIGLAITLVIVLTRPKPSPGPPSPGPPSPSSTSYFKAYVEDCQDVPDSYNLQELQKLDILGLDFTNKCYGKSKNLLGQLNNFKGKIFIHFDQTKDSLTCGNPPDTPGMNQSIFNACATTAKDQLGDLVSNIKGVLWEKEANKFINACESSDCKSAFSTAFGRKMLFAGWEFFEMTSAEPPSDWDYQFIEMYNIYSQCGACGTKNCIVDYNPLKKGGKCENNKKYFFEPASCGPPTSSGCEYGKEGMYSNALNIEQQATWLANIFKDQSKSPIPNPEKTVIFFPFTIASKPSFKDIITTEDDFNKFVQTFIDVLKDTSPGIENCMYGAWGAPKWIYGS
jgi:hypothetical protein